MSKNETRAELLLRQDLWKAGLLIKGLGTKAMDYENAVMCLKQTASILESMSFEDPAYAHFSKEANHFQKLSAAHALLLAQDTDVVKLDHVKPVEVMWCYRNNDNEDVVEETTLYIPLITRVFNIDFELSAAGSRRLIFENLKPENLASLQIVRQ